MPVTSHESRVTVVCCEWGNYLSRPAEYIAKLRAGVARHLSAPHEFVALRLPGPADPADVRCWNKLELFRPGRFAGRVLYLDLDSVIIGPLDELVRHKGAVHLADWGWTRNVHAGGCWVWDAGDMDAIWDRWTTARGFIERNWFNDQEWLTSLNVWAALPKGIVVSYRYHCKNGPPASASVVAFHGTPKPHECRAKWVKEAWRV